MSDLQKERAIAECVASFYAFCAADAEFFVDGVFVVRVLDKVSYYGAGGAEFILSAGVHVFGVGRKITCAEVTVSAYGVGMDAFYGGLFENAVSCAVSTGGTYFRVDLPDGFCAGCFWPKRRGQSRKGGDGGTKAGFF